MFSKLKINEPDPKADDTTTAAPAPDFKASPPNAMPAASVLSCDLLITGTLKTTGSIQIEGQIDGDIHAHLLTVGADATIKGVVIADDVVINGRVVGCVRGLKVRLTPTAHVEGDIVHKVIAIESGAYFEGSAQRQDHPLTGV
jgi:cytoskeletal protein CcmA (bactofilin family)